MARKKKRKKRLSPQDVRDLKIIEARKNEPTRPYEEVAREMGLPINDIEDHLL